MVRFAEGQTFGQFGTKIEGKTSVQEAMEKAGLNYDVELKECYTTINDVTIQVPKTKVTIRTDNNTVLGVVGDRYNPLKNVEAFQWFDEFINNDVATIEHAGQLGKSGIVFVQAKINTDPVEIIKGDAIESYITLMNSFNGKTNVIAAFTPFRLFCQNQLPALKASNKLSLKHTKNLHIGLEKIREIMDVHNREFKATTEQLRFLSNKGVNKKDLEKYVKLVFGNEENPEKEMRKSKVETIEELFYNGRGASEKTHNLYGAYNAVNEYLNWEAGRTTETRLTSLWTGVNASINKKALEIATELAA